MRPHLLGTPPSLDTGDLLGWRLAIPPCTLQQPYPCLIDAPVTCAGGPKRLRGALKRSAWLRRLRKPRLQQRRRGLSRLQPTAEQRERRWTRMAGRQGSSARRRRQQPPRLMRHARHRMRSPRQTTTSSWM